MNKEGKNLYVITARDKITPQMIERAEAAGIPKENIIPAGSDQEKVRIIKENNITKHIDNKDSVIKALGDKGELFAPDKYPDLKADFVEMELSDDDLNKLREGGFIIDKYPNAKYYQDGGVTPPEDYSQFQTFAETLPSNLQDPSFEYGNPDQYDLYGMWETVGKPGSFADVQDSEYFPLDEDGTYHGFTVGADGTFLKPMSHNTTWKEVMNSQLSLDPYFQENRLIRNEQGRLQYIPKAEYGMPLGAGMSQNYQGRRKFIHQDGGITSQEEIDAGNNAMMKARLAYAYMHGNPAAQRMVVAPDQPYDFGNGMTGTHYMASMDNYAVPQIQDVNGQLMLGDYGPESAEAIRFDSDEDANYFAENYKQVTPDASYRQEEYAKGGDPGKGKKGKSKKVEPFVTSDPDEYAFRKAAYDDSLNLYRLDKEAHNANYKSALTRWIAFTQPTSKNIKKARQASDAMYAADQRLEDYNRISNIKNDPMEATKTYAFGRDSTGLLKGSGLDVIKKKGKYVFVRDDSKSFTRPVQPVQFKKEQQPIVEQEIIEPTPIPQPVPTPTPIIVNPELQKFVEERKPEPPSGYPGIMPQYDIDEVPMYATPDPDAEIVTDTKRYIDWNGNSVGYRLPRFRQPGHGGPLIKAGKKHYFHYPSIETRNQIQIIPEEEYKKGGEPKKRKKDSKGRYRSENGNIHTPLTPEMQAVMPPEEWGQYILEVPEVYTTRTKEQQDIKNALDYQQRMAELYPGRPTQSDAIQPADWFWQLGMLGATSGLGKSAVQAAEAAGSRALPYITGALETSIPGMASVPGATIGNAAGAYFAGDAIVNRLYPSTGKIQEGKYTEAATDIATGLLDLYGANMLSPAYKGAKATVSELGKFLGTEEGLLSNAYKVNPLALKENPEMLLYRTQPKNFKAGITEEEEIKSLITDKIIKGEKVPIWLHGKLLKIQNDPEPFRAALNQYHGQWFDKNPQRMEWYMKGRLDDVEGDILRLKLPKQEGLSYNLKNFPEAQKASLNYDAEFIVPREKLFEAEKFSTNDLQQLIQEDAAFNKPHWLRGYKEVPKELPGSPNTFKSSLGGMDMSKYEIKNPDYFTKLLDTYDSRKLSSTNKNFYKGLIESVKKQNGIATERQYNELQRLRTGNFNFGKKGYSNGGSINQFGNQGFDNKLNKFIR